MRVLVRRGIVRGGRVIVDDVVSHARRAGHGWYRIQGRTPVDTGRVCFEDWKDRGIVEAAGGTLQIQFHPRDTRFEWEGRHYLLRSMTFGEIEMERDGGSVLRGTVTPGGVRLETVSPELLPVIREFAFLLALRSEMVARQTLPAGADAGAVG